MRRKLRGANSPPKLGGVAAPIKKCCEATLAGRRRGGSKREPPRPRVQRKGTIYLIARPPLLTPEELVCGVCDRTTSRHTIYCGTPSECAHEFLPRTWAAPSVAC